MRTCSRAGVSFCTVGSRRVCWITLAATALAEPELLAHHFTQAGLTEAAIEWWGKAGQRSLERSALAEGVEQFTRALGQIAALTSTPALRRHQIKLQVALITPLMQLKGHAAQETKAAVEKARLLIDQSETLGEPPEDPLLLFSVLYGFWVANYVAFNGTMVRDLAVEFLSLAEKQRSIAPLMVGHRLVGTSLACTGEITKGRAHLDQAVALYDPAEHRSMAMKFGQDVRVAILSYRALALWMLGYPKAALADAEQLFNDAREINQATTLMYGLMHSAYVHWFRGNYQAVSTLAEESEALAEEKGALLWNGGAIMNQGCVLAVTGHAADAVQMITAGMKLWTATGATVWMPWYRMHLAKAYADLGHFREAWHNLREVMSEIEKSNERWWEAETNRIAGEIALTPPERNLAKAEAYFERALAVARQQQAKSWELRAAMSMARLWRDQGKRNEARNLLAPVYGWFTEGFDTRDLKEAKALLDKSGS